jgi:hypothetical protein
MYHNLLQNSSTNPIYFQIQPEDAGSLPVSMALHRHSQAVVTALSQPPVIQLPEKQQLIMNKHPHRSRQPVKRIHRTVK